MAEPCCIQPFAQYRVPSNFGREEPMAVFARHLSGVAAVDEGVPGGPPVIGAAVDETTSQTNSSVYPEPKYLVSAAVALVAGGILGTLIFDNWADAVTFDPPEGVGIFALFYIIAQVLERLQEPLTPYLASAPSSDGSRKNQLQANAEREKAVANSLAPVAEHAPPPERDVANKQRTVDQLRANLTALMFGTSALLAMIAAGYLKALLLTTVGVSGIPAWVNIVVTGVLVSAGTKVVHDVISNITESKEAKQDPTGTQ
jgi:hypothetical protein